MIETTTKLALVLAFTAAPLLGQAIQLAGGDVLVGEVQDATGEGLTFRRLDNGGVLDLTWSDLTPASADEMRRLKGLLVEDEEEVTVMADVIVYEVGGGALQEIVGRIVGESDKTFTVRRKGQDFDVQRRTIKDKFKRELPIFEVYTRDSYYQEAIAEIAPGEDADKHIELADRLRRAGDYEHAEQHLVRADELGGGRQKSQLQTMLARVRVMRESEAERGLLREIRVMRNRGEFEKARELIATFKDLYADSPLESELLREEGRLERERERSLISALRAKWESAIHSVAGDKCSDVKLSLAAVRDYAENGMAADVFDHLAERLDIERQEAEELWKNRFKYSKGRSVIFSFGVGSWVLGEDAIIKDTKVAEGKDAGLDLESDDPELKRIVRLIREHKQRARQIARRNAGQEEQTDEQWWKGLKLGDKRQWLRCYFAEFGGQMEVTAAHASPCANCEGEGSITELGTSGKPEKTTCQVCHGTRYTRLIRAR